MDKGFPLVSIVMCSYNGELFIQEQLSSLEKQTYPNIEFICSDNNSTDTTPSILKIWCSQQSNRNFFTCTVKGLNSNFYSALAYATGEYIIFCDQDDIWLPTKVEKLIAFHQQHPESSMVYCLSKEFNGEVPADTAIGKRNYLEGTDIRKTMLLSFTLGHNMCIRKEVLQKMPPSPDEVIAFDWWITVSAMCIGSIKCLPEVLTFWRKHSNNTTLFLNSARRIRLMAIKCRLTARGQVERSVIRDGQSVGALGRDMKTATTPEAQMRALKEWAVERMTNGTQTPLAWFQFMKLLEVIDTFLEADDDAGLHEQRPRPRAKNSTANAAGQRGVVRSRDAPARGRVITSLRDCAARRCTSRGSRPARGGAVFCRRRRRLPASPSPWRPAPVFAGKWRSGPSLRSPGNSRRALRIP